MINISVRLTADNTSDIQTTVENVLKDYLSGEEMCIRDRQYGANIEDLVIGKSYNFDFAESELRCV